MLVTRLGKRLLEFSFIFAVLVEKNGFFPFFLKQNLEF
jgi:hypothetical protein